MYKRLITSASKSIMANNYVAIERGSLYTKEHRVFFKDGEKVISVWHDVPMFADEKKQHFNMLCEIPRWTNAKMEIATKEPLNPIKQDVKNGKIRFVDNCFPHHGYIWNYGAIPQTWEDPTHVDPNTKAKGDNDPIDICEIGQKIAERGEIYPVKILGVIALIDEGETDWKLIAIRVGDPLANELNGINDVEQKMPGFLAATREWFRDYKIPAGKPQNQFAFDGEFKDRDFAHKVIQETHEYWQELMKKGEHKEMNIKRLTPEEAAQVLSEAPTPGPAAPIDPSVHKWHYVTK